MAWIAVVLAVLGGIIGWVALGRLELGAGDALGNTTDVLTTIEQSIDGSAETALATADALDAAAASLEQAGETSAATSEVAADMAEITATLPPTIIAVSTGLEQIDESIASVNGILDAIPLVNGQIERIDARLTDTQPLLDDLAEAEESLTELSAETARFGPESDALAAELNAVADELRDSIEDLGNLSAEVAETRESLPSSLGGDSPGLLIAKLVVALLALATIVGQLPNLFAAPLAATTTND